MHWVNTWCWTFDPRDLATYPFDLFPKQEEFLRWLEEREQLQEGGLAEKSRDVGFTWLSCAFATHRWLFRPNVAIGFGSRKLDLVDTIGDPDSIFEKIRILLRWFPQWMLPAGYSEQKHAGHCRIVNPVTRGTITGEGGDNIGRGGRSTMFFVDEAAHLEHPQIVDAALSQTTRCRIDISTPNGQGNSFHRRRFAGFIKVFTFHWKEDPRKNGYEVLAGGKLVASGHGVPKNEPDMNRREFILAAIAAGAVIRYPWYESEKVRIDDPVIVAQEIDIDYAASVEGIAIPAAWVRAAVDFVPPIINKNYPLVAGLDVADGGRNKNVLISRRGPIIAQSEKWGEGTTTETAWKARDCCRAWGVKTLHYDVVGVGAGIRGTYKTASEPLGFTANAVNTGQPPSDAKWPSGKKSRELFVNLRAELWYVARRRFEKTFEFVTQGIQHPAEELISIPNDPDLIAQLSAPLFLTTDTGKMKLESKDDMRGRGVASPDHADACVLTFSPQPQGMKFI